MATFAQPQTTAQTHSANIDAKYEAWKAVIGNRPVDVVAESIAAANEEFKLNKFELTNEAAYKKLARGRDFVSAVFNAHDYVTDNVEKPVAETEDFKSLAHDLRERSLARATNAMWFVLPMDVVNAVCMGIGNTAPLKELDVLDWETVFAVGGQHSPSPAGTWLDYVGQFRKAWQADRYPFPESDVKKLPENVQNWLNFEGLPSIAQAAAAAKAKTAAVAAAAAAAAPSL